MRAGQNSIITAIDERAQLALLRRAYADQADVAANDVRDALTAMQTALAALTESLGTGAAALPTQAVLDAATALHAAADVATFAQAWVKAADDWTGALDAIDETARLMPATAPAADVVVMARWRRP